MSNVTKCQMSWNVKCHKISNIMTCWCWIYYPKQKHSDFHTSERTIVPQTAIFRLGTLVPNYICPKLLFKLCHYFLVRGFKKIRQTPLGLPTPPFGIFPEQKIYPHLSVENCIFNGQNEFNSWSHFKNK